MQEMIFESPVWIADQFLNPHEILLDMEKLIELTDSAGFEIENVLGMCEDFSAYYDSTLILKQFNKLDKKKKLIALDLIQKPERYFVCLKKTVDKRRNK